MLVGDTAIVRITPDDQCGDRPVYGNKCFDNSTLDDTTNMDNCSAQGNVNREPIDEYNEDID